MIKIFSLCETKKLLELSFFLLTYVSFQMKSLTNASILIIIRYGALITTTILENKLRQFCIVAN